MSELEGLGSGDIFVTKFYFTKCQQFTRYSPKYMEIYNVCGIKLEMKEMHLHRIQV